MNIVKALPLIYPQIVARFPEVAKGSHKLLFAWGDTIFNPGGLEIPPELYLHESVHGEQQRGHPHVWWNQYLVDEEFRFYQELQAHTAEFAWLARNGNRNERRAALNRVAKKLAAPLYRFDITVGEAKRAMKKLNAAAAAA